MDLSNSQALQNGGEGAATLLDGMQIDDATLESSTPIGPTPKGQAAHKNTHRAQYSWLLTMYIADGVRYHVLPMGFAQLICAGVLSMLSP